jgi:HSP20 family protein
MLSLIKKEPHYGWGLFNLRNEVDKMFRDFYEDSETRESYWLPSVDITEDGDKLTLTAEIPGVKKEDVKISLNNGILTIEGEKKQTKEEKTDSTYRSERYYGKFTRSFNLTSEIDAEKIKADYDSGILKITLPKSEKVKPRQITIS